MLPTSRDVHVDQLLTNIAIAYADQRFIADQIFPVVPVRNRSGLIPTFAQSPWFRDQAKIRAPATKSERIGYSVGNDTYYCHRYSIGHEIPDEVRDNADSVWNLDQNGVRLVMNNIAMRKEIAWATDHFTTGKWGTDVVGGTGFTRWSDYATSLPFVDLLGYQDDVELGVGSEANTLVIGKPVWNVLKWHPDLIDVIKYTERGIVTEELFRSATGFDRVLIGRAMYTADPLGTAEASVTYQRVFGNHALVAYVSPSPSLLSPSSGYTFVWNRVPNAQAFMLRHRDEERETDIVEGNTYFDQKITLAKAGIFLSGAVA